VKPESDDTDYDMVGFVVALIGMIACVVSVGLAEYLGAGT